MEDISKSLKNVLTTIGTDVKNLFTSVQNKANTADVDNLKTSVNALNNKVGSPIVEVEEKPLLSTAYTVDFNGAPIQRYDFGSGASGTISFEYANLSSIFDNQASTVEVQIPVNSDVDSIIFPEGTQIIEMPETLSGAEAGKYKYHDIVFRKQKDTILTNYGYASDEDVEYFWIENAGETDDAISLDREHFSGGDFPSLECSYDKITWESDFDYAELSAGQRVYIRASQLNETWGTGYTQYKYLPFQSNLGDNGNLRVGGNLMTLVDGSGKVNAIPSGSTSQQYYYFYRLFGAGSGVRDASELKLTTLAFNAYTTLNGLFSNNAILEIPPKELPNVVQQIGSMYYGMFSACNSLQKAPIIRTTKIDGTLYAPFGNMFMNSPNVKEIEVHFTDWGGSNTFVNWVAGVAASGIFRCPRELPIEFGNNRIPTGWTIVNI